MAKVTYEFDLGEEAEALKIFQHSIKMYQAISDSRELIRQHFKNGSDKLSDANNVLQSVRECLYVDGLE